MMIIIKLFIAKYKKNCFLTPKLNFYYLCTKIVYFTKK